MLTWTELPRVIFACGPIDKLKVMMYVHKNAASGNRILSEA